MVDQHVHLESEKADAFRLQVHTLLKALLTRKQNRSARAYNAMPRYTYTLGVQCPCHLPRRARITRSVSDISIGCDLAAWHAPHLPQHVGEHAGLQRFFLRALSIHFFAPRFFSLCPAPVCATLRMIGFFAERRATS